MAPEVFLHMHQPSNSCLMFGCADANPSYRRGTRYRQYRASKDIGLMADYQLA
jgi:hypothetical protein